MQTIYIYDNFLDSNTYSKVYNQVMKSNNWEYGHKSASNPYDTPFWIMDLNDNLMFNSIIKNMIEAKTGKKFEINRVYANGQTFGQNGSYHKDDESSDTYTFCLYICPELPNPTEIVGGEIQFKLPDLPEYSAYSIETRNNRGVFFPSNYTHRGLSFGRYINFLRCCIAWKLKEIKQ